MVKLSKRKKSFLDLFKIGAVYTLEEAIASIEKFPPVKFDETVEVHIKLNVTPNSSDQVVRGTVLLPHGIGKKVRVAVICKGEQIQVAEQSGADFVGSNDLIDKIANGFMDFDAMIATPDMMRDLSKLGKLLGPRGLMPSPKAGTVTQDVGRVIKEIKAGRVEFKSDKQGDIHVGVGKRSFSKEQLTDNIKYLLEAVEQAKPASVKGNLIRSLNLSTTMGPGLKISI
ncbi:MAG: 50S ribosomal protein L1 [Candidatus Omnitrophota bacterium]